MRPQVSEEEAKELAAAHWGWAEPLQASPLAGYDDTNIRLSGLDGREAVLKVHNAGDSTCESQYAEAQNALLRVLAAAGIPIPAPLPLAPPPLPSAQPTNAAYSSSSSISDGASRSTDGLTLRITTENGQLHAVRMLSWCPGTLLVDVPQSAELYRQLGALLARVNRLLQGWQAPAWAAPALHRAFDWNLQQLGGTYARVRPHLLALPGLDVPLLDGVVQHFEAATSAAGPTLRQCIIHSDANERNVLVDGAAAAAAAAAAERAASEGRAADGSGSPEAGATAGGATGKEAGAAAQANGSGGLTAPASDGPGSPSSRAEVVPGMLISGLIDWGDACWQWLAAEPAIAAVYMMLLDCNAGDPLPAAAALVGGYESETPLLADERRLLRTLAMGRLAQSLSLGAYSASQQPDNTAYLLGTQKNGWRLLRTLWGLTDDAFLAALGRPPPAAAAAAAALQV